MNNKINSFLFNSEITIFIFFCVFFKADYLSNFPTLNLIFNFLTLSISLMVYFIYLIYQKFNKIKVDKMDLLISIYFIIIGFSTIINHQDVIYFLFKIIPYITIYLYTKLCIYNNPKKYLSVFNKNFIITTLINFISVILTNNRDINRVFFLGYDNSFTPYIVFGCFIQLIYYIKYYKELSTIEKFNIKISILFNISTCLMVRSASCKIGMALFVLSYILLKVLKIKNIKIFNYNFFFTFSVLLFLFIVIFRFQNYFEYIIVDLLKRDLTFTGRTYIWDNVMTYIKNNKLFGLGFCDMVIRMKTIGIYHAHSTYLNILFESGISGLIAYNGILIENGKYISKNKNLYIKNVISFLFFTFFIICITEVYTQLHIIYLLFALNVYYSNNIKEG